jgi:hypothetical protein
MCWHQHQIQMYVVRKFNELNRCCRYWNIIPQFCSDLKCIFYLGQTIWQNTATTYHMLPTYEPVGPYRGWERERRKSGRSRFFLRLSSVMPLVCPTFSSPPLAALGALEVRQTTSHTGGRIFVLLGSSSVFFGMVRRRQHLSRNKVLPSDPRYNSAQCLLLLEPRVV